MSITSIPIEMLILYITIKIVIFYLNDHGNIKLTIIIIITKIF